MHDLSEGTLRWAMPALLTKFELSSSELQLRDHLQASCLPIRSELISLGDSISVHEKTPAGSRGSLHVDFLEIAFYVTK